MRNFEINEILMLSCTHCVKKKNLRNILFLFNILSFELFIYYHSVKNNNYLLTNVTCLQIVINF